ncbi:hypothetical protein [Ornithinimicrobium kibberense]
MFVHRSASRWTVRVSPRRSQGSPWQGGARSEGPGYRGVVSRAHDPPCRD